MQGWYIPTFETEPVTGVVVKGYVESYYKANAAKIVRETYIEGTYLTVICKKKAQKVKEKLRIISDDVFTISKITKIPLESVKRLMRGVVPTYTTLLSLELYLKDIESELLKIELMKLM